AARAAADPVRAAGQRHHRRAGPRVRAGHLDDRAAGRRAAARAGAPAPRRTMEPRMSAETTTTTTAPRPTTEVGPPAAATRRRPHPPGSQALAVVRWTFLGLLAVYFVVPQLAMARFAFQ